MSSLCFGVWLRADPYSKNLAKRIVGFHESQVEEFILGLGLNMHSCQMCVLGGTTLAPTLGANCINRDEFTPQHGLDSVHPLDNEHL